MSIGVKFGITATGRIDLDEDEMRALYTLTLWGEKAFLEMFAAKMGGDLDRNGGKAGIRSLFKRINEQVPPILDNLDQARKLLLVHYQEKAKP